MCLGEKKKLYIYIYIALWEKGKNILNNWQCQPQYGKKFRNQELYCKITVFLSLKNSVFLKSKVYLHQFLTRKCNIIPWYSMYCDWSHIYKYRSLKTHRHTNAEFGMHRAHPWNRVGSWEECSVDTRLRNLD